MARSDRVLRGGTHRLRRLFVERLEDRSLLATIVVTGTGDSIAVDGLVTLREAITAANTNTASGDAPAGDAGLDTINFNIAGTGVHTISPRSDLPRITESVSIDGYTQPGASPNTLPEGNNAVLLIELQGNQIIAGQGFGLHFGGAHGSIVRGLVINGDFVSGIELSATTPTTGMIISGNFIGIDPTGK